MLVNEKFVDFEAEKFNQKPYVLSFFPSNSGKKVEAIFEIDNKNILLSSYKNFKNGQLIRLFNATSENQSCCVKTNQFAKVLYFEMFEVKTFVAEDGSLVETDMLGNIVDCTVNLEER